MTLIVDLGIHFAAKVPRHARYLDLFLYQLAGFSSYTPYTISC